MGQDSLTPSLSIRDAKYRWEINTVLSLACVTISSSAPERGVWGGGEKELGANSVGVVL